MREHKLAPFLLPLSSHCAEHPVKGLPDSSDPHSTGWPARSSLGYHSSIFLTTSPDSVSRLSLELYLTHGRMRQHMRTLAACADCGSNDLDVDPLFSISQIWFCQSWSRGML